MPVFVVHSHMHTVVVDSTAVANRIPERTVKRTVSWRTFTGSFYPNANYVVSQHVCRLGIG